MTEPLLTYVPPEGLLQDRVILVTGAAMGIGRAAALAYARFGATVVLLDKQVALMEQVYDEIEAMGAPEAAIYPLDMQGASATDYEAMAANLQDQLGRLDGVLLNAAWLAAFMSVRQHGVDLWFKMINVNLHANFMLVRACFKAPWRSTRLELWKRRCSSCRVNLSPTGRATLTRALNGTAILALSVDLSDWSSRW